MQNKFNTIRDEIGLKDKDNVEEATCMTDNKDVSVVMLRDPWAHALVDKAKSLKGNPANVNPVNKKGHPMYSELVSTGPRVYEVCVPFQPSRVLQPLTHPLCARSFRASSWAGPNQERKLLIRSSSDTRFRTTDPKRLSGSGGREFRPCQLTSK